MTLPNLTLPNSPFRTKLVDVKLKIFDTIRRKWLVLTPEEWVRQNMTAYLLDQKQVPPIRMVNEVAIAYNNLQLRCDALSYDNQCKPLILIEYKAPHIPLDQKVFDQIAVYNNSFHLPYLFISNGMQHIFCTLNRETNTYTFLPDIPNYNQLLGQ